MTRMLQMNKYRRDCITKIENDNVLRQLVNRIKNHV